MTAKEFAELNGFTYPVAKGILDILVEQGKAFEIGKQKSSAGKGKPSTVYQVNEDATLSFLSSKMKKVEQKTSDEIASWVGETEASLVV